LNVAAGKAVGQHVLSARAGLGGERSAERIVVVDDARFECGPREELRLGGAVVGHRDVIVEVIAREIREQRDVELDTVDAALIESVRRDFHRDGTRAFASEAASVSCSAAASGVVRADGSSELPEALPSAPTMPLPERAEDAAFPAARVEALRDPVRARRSCRWCPVTPTT
jgi:hypothetical protein